jgi:hypothetical protein
MISLLVIFSGMRTPSCFYVEIKRSNHTTQKEGMTYRLTFNSVHIPSSNQLQLDQSPVIWVIGKTL